MGTNLENELLKATKVIEKHVEETIEKLDRLDVDDLDQLRKQRLKELKQQEIQRAEWLEKGHGTYEELPEEKEFFNVIKKSPNVVVHFYTNSSPRCAIVDKHLKILAPKHVESRFVKLNAEKCPFLAENLKIKTIPTIVLVHNNVMVDKIVGFTQLGNRDDFSTEMMEWRIAQNDIINYEGDKLTPPDFQQEKKKQKSTKKIRDGFSHNDDDLDIEEYRIPDENAGTGQKSGHLSTDLTAEEAAELGLDE